MNKKWFGERFEKNDYKLFWGELHTHTAMGDGGGDIDETHRTAQMNLDFWASADHGQYPDLPVDNPQYIESRGTMDIDCMKQVHDRWEEHRQWMAASYEPGNFVSFLGYEWASDRYGDFNVYFLDDAPKIIEAQTLEELYKKTSDQNIMLIPHHCSYIHHERGTDWENFDAKASPVTEIYSSHGSSECDPGPYPLYHVMGPRVGYGTIRNALNMGLKFGIIASSDDHSGHPGSHRCGLAGVYAKELTRKGIWDGFFDRRTTAVTGDRISAWFQINGVPLGSEITTKSARDIQAFVTACDYVDKVELIKNGKRIILAGPESLKAKRLFDSGKYKFRIEWGWGVDEDVVKWNFDMKISNGVFSNIEPCMCHPQGDKLLSVDKTRCKWFSATIKNPSRWNPYTKQLICEIDGSEQAQIRLDVNGATQTFKIEDILERSFAMHPTDKLVPPFLKVHRAVPEQEYQLSLQYTDKSVDKDTDYYYLRVSQENGQMAWTSPIWVNNS